MILNLTLALPESRKLCKIKGMRQISTFIYDQSEFDIRCEWGMGGVTHLLPHSEVFIIVDVLSFSTSVDIAFGNGAIVFPYQWKDESAADYAASLGAMLAGAGPENSHGYSLSPASLVGIPAGTRLVLPSPNGATLSLATGKIPTFAGCLRNAKAVAKMAQNMGRRISVVPAGEKWEDGSMRPAIEDLIGAGAIITELEGRRSPEAEVAEAAYLALRSKLFDKLRNCSSGKELVNRGRAKDVELAAALNKSGCAPVLNDGAYRT